MDANDVGQGKTYTQGTDKYDAENGKYDCNHSWRLQPGQARPPPSTGAAATPFTTSGGDGK